MPRKLSRYIWFSIGERAKLEAELHKKDPMAYPLVHGGLEISIKASVTWDEPEKLAEFLWLKLKRLSIP